jgi:hypothetical protein
MSHSRTPLVPRREVAVRTQLEYFGFHAYGYTTIAARLSLGIVHRIGKNSCCLNDGNSYGRLPGLASRPYTSSSLLAPT